MKICDKCEKKSMDLVPLKIDGAKVELCPECIRHIKTWIQKGPEKKSLLGEMFSG